MKSPPYHLPAVAELGPIHQRMDREENHLRKLIREAETKIRDFTDLDQPAFQIWLLKTFGPLVSAIQETHQKIQRQQVLLHRVQSVMETQGYHPREALYEALRGTEPPEQLETQARKKAKLEAKRAHRREAKKVKQLELRQSESPDELTRDSSQKKILTLYRQLARQLHPDATRAEGAMAAHHHRVWLEVQNAYEASDINRLTSLSLWLNEGANFTENLAKKSHFLSLSERHATLRTLRKTLAQTERRVTELQAQPAWNFKSHPEGVPPQSFHRKFKSELEHELTHALNSLETCEEAVRSIGPPRPPRVTPDSRRGRR